MKLAILESLARRHKAWQRPEIMSSDNLGVVASEVCTAVIAVIAIILTFYPIDTLWLKMFVLIVIAQPCLELIVIAIERKHLIEIERAERNERAMAHAQLEANRHAENIGGYQALRAQLSALEAIIKSDKPDREKVEATALYVVAVNAFELLEEITRYLENNKLPPPRKVSPAIRALGGALPWDETPEATMARAYKETFGDRLKALVAQFKDMGINLPQKDEAYFNPGMYSRVPFANSQIKDAASQLVAALSTSGSASVVIPASGSLEIKKLGFAAEPTVKKPEGKK